MLVKQKAGAEIQLAATIKLRVRLFEEPCTAFTTRTLNFSAATRPASSMDGACPMWGQKNTQSVS